MELNCDNLKQKSSLIKSVTGLKKEKFDYLIPAFEMEWDRFIENYTFEVKHRIKKRKVRKNNTFKSVPDMLIFILYDYRHNPTQDFMGLHFSLTQPKVALWIKVLEPILERSLKKLKLLQTRENIKMNDWLVDSVTILLYGSEQPINRPKYDQKEYYSGKKEHTVKNNLIANQKGMILYLSDTYPGSVHDKKICDIESLEFDKNITLLVDLGFIGLTSEKATILIPCKKRRTRNFLQNRKNLIKLYRCQE